MHPTLKMIAGHLVLLGLALAIILTTTENLPSERKILLHALMLAVGGASWAVFAVPRFWLRSLLLAMVSAVGFCIYLMGQRITWTQEHDAWCEGCVLVAGFMAFVMVLAVLFSGAVLRAIARRSSRYRERMKA